MKTFSRLVSLAIVLVVSLLLFPAVSQAADTSTAYQIVPIKKTDGWSIEMYDVSDWNRVSIDETYYPTMLNTNVDSNGYITVSRSAFATRTESSLQYMLVGPEQVIDLSKDNYFYFDFTAKNILWSISISFGEEGYFSADTSLNLTPEICRVAMGQNLIEDSTYGTMGVCQGRIDLNKVLEVQKKTRMDGSSYANTKIHIKDISFGFSTPVGTDVAQIRNISFGHGNKTFAAANYDDEIKIPASRYKPSNIIGTDGKYNKDSAISLPITSIDGWKTSISRKETGELNDKSPYLKVSASEDGMTILPTGASIRQKAYIQGFVVGWPKLTYTYEEAKSVYLKNAYLYYDFTMNTSWDIILYFNKNYRISLADILNGLDSKGAIDDISLPSGTRGYGIPGKYKGAINLEKVLTYYKNLNGGYYERTTTSLTGIDIIYENTDNDSLSLKNIVSNLTIAQPVLDTDAAKATDVKDTVVSVYKPEGYSAKLPPVVVEKNIGQPGKTQDSNVRNIIVGVIVFLVFLAGIIVVAISINRRKAKEVNENGGGASQE